MTGRMMVLSLAVMLVVGTQAAAETMDQRKEQVRQAETAFARSMAEGKVQAFAALIAEDAVFFGNGGVVHRGKAAIVESWRPLFAMEKPPFSWASADVEVLSSGTLAHSSGPVHDASGKRSGTFNSIWRREPDGSWKVIFDKGCNDCPAAGGPEKKQ